jgi:hypothetical protein
METRLALEANAKSVDVGRRDVLKAGGVMLLGGVVGGCATATEINPLIPPVAKLIDDTAQTRATPAEPGASIGPNTPTFDKPTFVPRGSDPFDYSLADNLFWNDIMMEHAMFFVQLMPGPELDGPRKQAEEFQRLFERQLQQSSGLKPDNYVAFNRSSIGLAKRVSDYKKTKREAQATGKIRSLVWPSFFEHTADEADRFAARLQLYNRGRVEFQRTDVVEFWSKTMGEHAGFIAHLLDPEERLLIDQARKLERSFLDKGFRQVSSDNVLKAANEVLAFKAVAEKGIYAGKIKSIISPRLVSHVRREALRFTDELKRAS